MLLNSITLFFFYTNITHLYIPSFPTRRSSDLVNILTEAEHSRNPSPVSPKPALNMAIAFVLGGMIGVGLAFLLEYLDKDRKSTRLNSSHVAISYAVFCLKKKRDKSEYDSVIYR